MNVLEIMERDGWAAVSRFGKHVLFCRRHAGRSHEYTVVVLA